MRAIVTRPSRREIALRLVVVVAVILSHAAFGAEPAHAVSLVVNSTADNSDATPGDGVCATAGGACTLRAAIEEANALAGADSILFDIPANDPGRVGSPRSYTIQPATSLPPITGQLILDGATQPDYAGSPIIVIDGVAAGNVDGIALEANDSEIRGLVVQNFDDPVAGAAIVVTGNRNVIAGNYTGTDVTGTLARGNDDGILVYGDDNIIGGTNAADRNVASGNADDGVSIDAGTRTVILGNYVGVNASGTGAIANLGDGVAVQFGATGIVIGGTVGNVISGNGGPGVRVRTGGTDGTSIRGNLIGTDVTGNVSLGNGTYGIYVTDGAANTTIGPGNVISGNTLHGVLSDSTTTGTVVVGNRVGTNSNGTAAVPNGGDGVYADSNGMIIGGSGAGEGNVISGNARDGLRLERLNQVVKGNLIGTDITGSLPLGNGEEGVDTGSGTAGSVIGGTAVGDGNTIAFNGDRGITFRQWPGTSGVVLGNSIFRNGDLGIDLLGDGVTANDPGDVDAGPPNELLNFPEIQSMTEALGTVYVDFDLDLPAGDYRIEFFKNPSGADSGGWGEGEIYSSYKNVYHTGSGLESFSHSFSGSAGDIVTSTTTHCTNDSCTAFDMTSEFSKAYTATSGGGNSPPVLDAVGNKAAAEGSELTFTPTASDPDLDGLTFSLSGEPSGAAITAGGVFTWTPSEAQGPGSYVFDVVVTDDGSPNLNDSETITVTVSEVNVAPVLDTVGDKAVAEQNPLTFTATANDVDDPANTLSFSLSGEPTGAAITSGGVFTWTPSEAQGPGVYVFDVVVTDDGTPNLDDSETITVTVTDDNLPPVLDPIGNRAVTEQNPLTFTATGSDPDLDGLTFSLSGEPTGAAITSGGVFTWTPTEAQGPGVYVFDVVVTDNGSPNLNDSETITVTVSEGNVAPVVTDPGSQVGVAGDTVSLMIVATDSDEPANVLTWSASDLPAGLSIDPDTGEISGTLTVPGPIARIYTVSITVDDGTGETSTVVFSWTVGSGNLDPIANDDFYSVIEGETLEVPASGVLTNDTDPDGNALFATLLVGPKQGVLSLNSDGSFDYMHTSSTDTNDSFTYQVSDGLGGVDTGVVTISVLPRNADPVAIVDVYVVSEDTSLLFDPLANDFDPDGDPLALGNLIQPDVGVITPQPSGQLRYDPPENFAGSTTATYTARDFNGGSATAQIQITVTPVNDAPVGSSDTFILTGYLPQVIAVLSNDVDVDGDTLSIVSFDDPAVGTLTLESGVITFTPPDDWVGTTTFSYTLVDAAGATDTAVVTVTLPNKVLVGARALAAELGVEVLPLATIAPPFVSEGLSLTVVNSVNLLANVFFQTIDAFQLPLIFLAMSLVMLVAMGGVARVPVLLGGRRSREHWSGVFLNRETPLHVYEEPTTESQVIYNFNPTTESILSTGRSKTVDRTEWKPVHTARGEGWVKADHLTEQVDMEEFVGDKRRMKVVDEFADRLRTGGDVTGLISDRGIVLALTGAPARLAPQQFAALMGGSRLRRLPTDGGVLHDQEDFQVAVAEPFLAALDATTRSGVSVEHSQAALIPAELRNFRYISVGRETSQPWLVFFEYQDGKPRIVGLGIDE